jgi:hypothetical protein
MMVPYDDSRYDGHHLSLASSSAINSLSNMNSVQDELFLQDQIQQQLLSPAPRSRNGSFQYHSLSPAMQHEAELQSYVPMNSASQSATFQNGFSGYGVDMQRGGSYASVASRTQFSETSSGLQSGYGQQHSPFSAMGHSQQHSPFSALDDGFPSIGRSRSVSQGLNISSCPFFDTGVGRDPVLFDFPQSTNISANDLEFGSQHGLGAEIDVNAFTKADKTPILL